MWPLFGDLPVFSARRDSPLVLLAVTVLYLSSLLLPVSLLFLYRSCFFFTVSLLLLGIYHYLNHVVCIKLFYSIPYDVFFFQILKVAMMLHKAI
jgi:hypothetical protein